MRMSPVLSSRPPMTIREPPFPLEAGNTGGCAGDGVSPFAAACRFGRRGAVEWLRFFATEHHLTIRAAQEHRSGDDAPIAHQDAAVRDDVDGLERAWAEGDHIC